MFNMQKSPDEINYSDVSQMKIGGNQDLFFGTNEQGG